MNFSRWILSLFLAGCSGSIFATEPKSAPAQLIDLGTHTLIFDPSMPMDLIQRKVDEIFAQQEKAEFGPGRYALLFKPGVYHLNVRVGFYTEVLGLGTVPDEVTIVGHVSVDAQWAHGNATVNFWRAAENIRIVPDGGTEKWAVSQACPLRRVHIEGSLELDDHGWSSGGFLADSVVEGKVLSGHQQQWLTRNSQIGGWESSSWNMVFVGVKGAPPESFPKPPYVTIDHAPRIAEKPFLSISEGGRLGVVLPMLKKNTVGIDFEAERRTSQIMPLERFYIAKPGDTALTLNRELSLGKSLLFTPGSYELDRPLRIDHPNTVVLGLGFPTLVANGLHGALEVADVDGVKIAGLLIAAGSTESETLMKVGESGSSLRHVDHPTELFDVFFRVGGAEPGKTKTALSVASADVIADDLWIWRADHGSGVGWQSNTAAQGLMVDGANVTIYGLAVEHFQGFQTIWNGEGGHVYFYQSEEPYDVPTQADWTGPNEADGFASYYIGGGVKTHEARGLGIYCFFHRNPKIKLTSAIIAPSLDTIVVRDVTTISLGGGVGEISHLINNIGDAAKPGHIKATLVSAPPARIE